jgi:predicted Ser/Thr protein kinase
VDIGGVTTDAVAPELAPATFVPGAVVAGRYRLESRLGAGGGGTVWRCFDQQLDAVVALKIVSRDGDVERWRREVAMARRIADRNVCRVHDLGETDDARFVTMELVEGTSLRSRIRADLPAAEARELWRQIVSGAAAIHAAGVVHRDLKPENVVVADDGRAVIVDFGLAREPRGAADVARAAAVQASPPPGPAAITVPLPRERTPTPRPAQTVTNTGTVVGTPRYMSPEQAAGETVDARCDVWSLGLIGHELFAGALPEPGATRPIASGVDAKWPGIAGVLRRCLAPSPADRFADARELLAALSRPRRRVALRAALALGAMAAVAGGTLIARSLDHAPSKRVAKPNGPYRMQQITTTAGAWPGGSPFSIALSPDARRFAYTTGSGKLYVRDLDGGAEAPYPLPKLPASETSEDDRDLFVTTFAAGWFSDGSIAELGSTRRGDWQLVRVHSDGRAQLLYRHAQRFTAAVSVDDRVVIGIPDYAIFVIPPGEHVTPTQIATIGRETIMGLVWSPDGTRIAYSRMPPDPGQETVVQIMSATGSDIREVWRGHTLMTVDTLLVWLDDERLAHSYQDPVTRKTVLTTIDVATRAVTVHDEFTGTYVGIGSGARGIVILLRGDAHAVVEVGDKSADYLVPLHDPKLHGGLVAGWTPAGQVVFAAGAEDKLQAMRASPGSPPEPWPNTRPGVEVPDTLVGDDLIAHRVDGDKLVVERIDPAGAHHPLVELPATPVAAPVRCAGDRGPPCMLEQTEGNMVRWLELDPATGTRGAVIHQRQAREQFMRDAALSPDGSLLAIVDGNDEVSVIDRATGGAERPRSAGDGAALQSLGFGPNNELWATSIGYRGRLFGLMSFSRTDKEPRSFGPAIRRGPTRDSMRFYRRPMPSPDGAHVALTVREFHIDVWRADGL